MKAKANIGTAILFAVISLVMFYAVAFISSMVIAFTFDILSKIPIIRGILHFIFASRGDDASMLSVVAGYALGYLAVKWLIDVKLNDTDSTKLLSLKIAGAVLFIGNTVMFIIAIVNKAPHLFPYFVGMFFGALTFIHGREKKDVSDI